MQPIEHDGSSTRVEPALANDFDTSNRSLEDADELKIGSFTKAVSLSDKAVSRTSTEEYDHTPFAKFSLQVRELCHLLWPPGSPASSRVEHLMGGTSNDGLISKLRRKGSVRVQEISSSTKAFAIERLKGGGFNRIIGITVTEDRQEEQQRCILRVPRYHDARHDLEVAVLRFIREYTTIPVPEVRFVDFTSNNPLQERYMIQSEIPGYDLQTESTPCWYPNLTHKQKCTVAKELARLLLELQSVTHKHPGQIEASTDNVKDQTFKVRPFSLEWHEADKLEADLNTQRSLFQVHPFDAEWEPPELKLFEESTYYFICAQFGRWRAFELRRDPASIAWWDYFDRLVTATKQMDDLFGLGDDENCLCHLDLNTAPRNIMACIDDSDKLTKSGILDWDSAIFAPRYVGCAPPMWPWAWSNEEEEDEIHANDVPATVEQQELKQIFDEAMGDWFLNYAYKPEYRLARELFRFARVGIGQSTDIEEVEKLLEEWTELFESRMALNKVKADDEHSTKHRDSPETEMYLKEE